MNIYSQLPSYVNARGATLTAKSCNETEFPAIIAAAKRCKQKYRIIGINHGGHLDKWLYVEHSGINPKQIQELGLTTEVSVFDYIISAYTNGIVSRANKLIVQMSKQQMKDFVKYIETKPVLPSLTSLKDLVFEKI